jgi:hypothetical protein
MSDVMADEELARESAKRVVAGMIAENERLLERLHSLSWQNRRRESAVRKQNMMIREGTRPSREETAREKLVAKLQIHLAEAQAALTRARARSGRSEGGLLA